MKNILILFMALIKVSYCVQEYENEKISFIVDFLNHSKRPMVLIGFLCWNNEYSIELNKQLSKNGFLSNIMFQCNMEKLQSLNHRNLFLIDVKCPFAERCLKLADSLKLLRAPYQWIILDGFSELSKTSHLNLIQKSQENKTEKTIFESPYIYFGDKSILSDSDIIVATRDAQQSNYKLTQYYKYRLNSEIIIEHFGYWSEHKGIVDERSDKIISMRRKNLKKATLTASIVITNNDTINHLDDYRDTHIDTNSKVNYKMTAILIDFLNGTHNYSFVNSWGYKLPDGNWSGMIGDMTKQVADIGGSALFMLLERLPALEFISITSPTNIRFVFRQPPLSYVSNIFVLPFQWTVWWAIVLLVALVCCTLYVAAYWEQKQSSQTKSDDKIPAQWGEVCMVALGAVSQQGTTKELQSISGRIIILLLFIALMFLYTSYSANIVALLQSQSNSINTLTDLLNSRLKLGALDVVYNRQLMPRVTGSVRQALWTQKIAPKGSPQFYSLKEGVELIRRGLFAFHMEMSNGYKIISDTFLESEKCGITEIQFLDVANAWYAVQRNTSFKEMFKIGMRRLHECGIQAREVNKILTKKPTCTITGGGGFVSVGLIEMGPALLWLASGMVLAISIFIFEKLYESQ